MRILLSDIKVKYSFENGSPDEIALQEAERLIRKRLRTDPENLQISKKSIDARKGITFVYSVTAEVGSLGKIPADLPVKMYSEEEIKVNKGQKKLVHRPVIVGFGPAGMFAGLILSENGYSPVILERGADVETRVRRVDDFINNGILDTETNVQFGAGGAGTFSDGKLTTRINDTKASYVLKVLHSLGAPDDIVYKAKPHVGTDVLRDVVKNADRRIRELGGDIIYNCRASNIRNHRLSANGNEMGYDALVLAIGHSARDTYAELLESSYMIEPKPFSVGVRIEHLQEDIDRAMYGVFAGDPQLGHAEYQLSYRNGARGCYSFCMCPGGYVVPSSSDMGEIVTNGMSRRARDGINANSALCVSVNPEDYGSSPERAIEYQKNIEKRAFAAGGGNYAAPYQTVGDLLSGNKGSEYSRVVPTYMDGNVRCADLSSVFPPYIISMLKEGIHDFGKKIKGFDSEYIPLTGVETRTSSPVRIIRNEDYEAPGMDGVYPCGEGAGYAGGIVSAAVDGIRVALKIMEKYSPIL